MRKGEGFSFIIIIVAHRRCLVTSRKFVRLLTPDGELVARCVTLDYHPHTARPYRETRKRERFYIKGR